MRDASWHPNAGVLAATSWNEYGAGMGSYGTGTGSVTLHGWGVGGEEEGEDGPVRLNCWGKRDPRLYIAGERMEETSDVIRRAIAHILRGV